MGLFFGIWFVASVIDIGPLAFLAAVVWFYSFFDCVNKVFQDDEEFYAQEDRYLFTGEQLERMNIKIFQERNLLVGGVLVVIGIYALWNNVVLHIISEYALLSPAVYQTIVNFGLVNVPVEYADAPLFATKPIDPDVQTNAKPFDGRIYLIVLDDLHISAQLTPRVRTSAKRLVQQMGANDVAAVVTTGGTTYAAQEFTGNKRLLTAAIDNFMGRSLRSSTLNRVDDYNRMRSSPTGVDSAPKDIEEHERAYFARNTLSSIKQLSEFMSGVRGRRKALVFFSEGIDYDILDVFTHQYAGDVRDATREAIAAATRANVSIYSVTPAAWWTPPATRWS
jgi:VWFA-related protein